MKIVLDANIFISSFFWGGNPKIILERIISGIDELFITNEILDEIENVLRRPKFHADNDRINYLINLMEEIAIKITPQKLMKKGSRDRKDNKYIECGKTASVQFIISGDIHLLELNKYENMKILSAKEYLVT